MMSKGQHAKWQKLTITPEEVMAKLEPGMSIFLGGYICSAVGF